MEVPTYKRLLELVEAAAQLREESPQRFIVARELYTLVAGSEPESDHALVDKLKTLNQQFTDEKNASDRAAREATTRADTLRVRCEALEARLASVERLTGKHALLTANLAQMREMLHTMEQNARRMAKALEKDQ